MINVNMRPAMCSSTSRALYRVFICPISRPIPRHAPPQILARQPQARTIFVFAKPNQPVRKPAAHLSFDKEHPIDEAIDSRVIHLTDETGVLQRERYLAEVLESIDRKVYKLRQVARDATDNLPICKVTTLQAIWAERRAKEKAKSSAGSDPTKQVELNWAADPNDVRHRVKRMQDFLREGRPVEVLLAPKPQKKGRRATPDEIESILKAVRAGAGEVDGAEEWKVMEGVAGKQVVLYFQAKQTGQGAGKKPSAKEASMEKAAKKDAEKEERRLKQEKRMAKVRELQESRERLAEQFKVSS